MVSTENVNLSDFPRLQWPPPRSSFTTLYGRGGVCLLHTMNVADSNRRNVIEDALVTAGFYIPYQKSDRWYRQQMESLRVDRRPPESDEDGTQRDQPALDWVRADLE